MYIASKAFVTLHARNLFFETVRKAGSGCFAVVGFIFLENDVFLEERSEIRERVQLLCKGMDGDGATALMHSFE